MRTLQKAALCPTGKPLSAGMHGSHAAETPCVVARILSPPSTNISASRPKPPEQGTSRQHGHHPEGLGCKGQGLGSLPEPEPPQGRTALAGQSQPCCKRSFLQLALVCGTGHTGCPWFSCRDGGARVQSTSGSPESGNALMSTSAGNKTCQKHAAVDQGAPWGTSTRPRGCSEHLGSAVAVRSCHPSWTNRAALTPKATSLRLSGDVGTWVPDTAPPATAVRSPTHQTRVPAPQGHDRGGEGLAQAAHSGAVGWC